MATLEVAATGAVDLTQRRLGEQVAALLAADIVGARIKPSDEFPSAEAIGQRFGVSRTVARETIQTLSTIGLVRVQQGKRPEILRPEEWDVLSPLLQQALRSERRAGPVVSELYQVRLLLEPAAAAWTAERASIQTHATIVAQAQQMKELAGEANLASFLAMDREFHNDVAHASGNRVLAAVRRDISAVLATLWSLSELDQAGMELAAAHHDAIALAIARRDSGAARQAMEDHLMWASRADLGRLDTSGG